MKDLREIPGGYIDTSSRLAKTHNKTKMNAKQKHMIKTERIMVQFQNELGRIRIRDKHYFIISDTIMEEARQYYDKVYQKDILPDMPIKFRAGICIYLAASLRNHPITIEDVVSYLNNKISVTRFKTHVNTIKGALCEFKIAGFEKSDLVNQAKTFLSEIEIDDNIQTTLLALVKKSCEKGIHCGHHQKAFIASLIHGFIINNKLKNKIKQRTLAKLAGVHQSTISNISRKLLNIRGFYEV